MYQRRTMADPASGARCAVRHARRAPCDGSKCDNWLHMTPYPISYRDAVVHDKLLMMSS